MIGEPVYLLDANVFIEAARRYYAFDLAPGFWRCLDDQVSKGRIRSIDRVRIELERGKDELSEWIKIHFTGGFASTDNADIFTCYSGIINWVQSQAQFSGAAKSDFARGADGWLVAYAKIDDCVVVTHELPAPDAKRKVPIPNVCRKFGVQFVNTFEMLRMLQVRFV